MNENRRRVCPVTFAVVTTVVLMLYEPAASQEKQKPSVTDESLDILRRGGQITREQQEELRERARKEAAASRLAGGFASPGPLQRDVGQREITL